MTSSKNSLAYDLQETFRFLVDLAVISLVESGAMETKDFIRTENYNLRLKPSGARKIINAFSNMLEKKVSYQGKESTWSYIVFLKVKELALILLTKKRNWILLSLNIKLREMIPME
jgi:CRISPR-associated protein Cas1